MMKYWVGFILIIIGSISCRSDKQEDVEVRHGYYFFPKSNVYYDTADKNFIYFDTGARQWQQGNLPPAFIQSELGKSVLLDTFPVPVWSGNKEHQLIYSARLYGDSSDFKKPPPPVVAEKPKKKTPKTDTVEDTPGGRQKTKVGQLLERIFGQKRNSDN